MNSTIIYTYFNILYNYITIHRPTACFSIAYFFLCDTFAIFLVIDQSFGKIVLVVMHLFYNDNSPFIMMNLHGDDSFSWP